MSPRPSPPASFAATVVTSGSHSPPPRTTPYKNWGGSAGNATVPHMSGTSLDAQARYAAGTKAILESYFTKKEDYRPEDLIVHKGDYATKAYGQRTEKRQAS
jgi:formate dehydrogenase